jgi:geranylgeranyl pyrophosphate synthase
LIEAAAVPAVAVPLLQDGCADTTFDHDWLLRAMHAGAAGPAPLELQALHSTVEAWFSPAALEELLGAPASNAQSLALEWLGGPGKRWRPFLAAGVHAALACDGDVAPPALRSLALAVECFHKASLIHDDIEDSDEFRYGRATVHKAHGVPIALNVGDLLLGEGYRLIAACGLEGATVRLLLEVASQAHRDLCLGQGQELWWLRNPRPLSVAEVVEIFAGKTAPAFEVALRFGAACAGQEEQVRAVLTRYSRHLGIAYQIQDDLADLRDGDGAAGDLAAQRPSILLALAYEAADQQDRATLEQVWRRQLPGGNGTLDAILARTAAPLRARQMLAEQISEAMAALSQLQQPRLKQLLRQVAVRIFHKWLPPVEGADEPRMGLTPDHPQGP